MIWIVIVLCLFFAIIALLFYNRVKIIIEYRNGKLKIIFKSLFLKFTIDEKRLNKLSSDSNQKNGKKTKKTENSEKSGELTAESFLEKVESFRKTLLLVREVIVTVFGYAGDKVEFVDIMIKSRFGTGDAGKTGMICGAFWTLMGNAYAFLCRFFRLDFPDVQLEPDFEKKVFEIETRGIIKIRPVHIITAAIRGFKVYDKHKNEKGVD